MTQKQHMRFKLRVDRLKKALLPLKWKQVEALEPWGRRARSLVAKLAAPAGAQEAELELDISTADIRAPAVSDLVEDVIKARLKVEGYASDEERYERADRATMKALLQQIDLDRPDVETEAPCRSIDEVAEEHARRYQTLSASLVRDFWATTDFTLANRGNLFRVHENMAAPSPHKHWVEKIKARYTGRHLIGPEVEQECREPDVSPVPSSVPLVDPNDIILTVAVCSQLGHKEQEFDVLASQRLYELRDALYFATDWMYDGPVRMKSACFFIDGRFYSDKRHATALDYSKELIEFLEATRPGSLRDKQSKSMDVRIKDLDSSIPFGEKWVYIHQGDIEQNIYFTNARLFHRNNDCPFREAYPVLTFMRRYSKKHCSACVNNFAVWQVLDSSRCPMNPSYWCAQCFRHFFQDKDGNYIPPVDYKAFPYLHDPT